MQTLLRRYIEGDATAEEKQQVILWLEEDEAHIQEYKTLRKLHNLNTWNAEPEKRLSLPGKKSNLPIWRKITQECLKIASVLLVGVLISYSLMLKNEEEVQMQTIHVPYGQRAELFLSDGTEVWLNSGTTMTFPNRFMCTSRYVSLDGEGYFKVTKDEKKPFIVHTGQYDVRVLGTEFNLKSYAKNNHFETALLKGSVEIVSEYMQPVRLKENEVVHLSGSKLVKSHITDFNYFKWREGLICFEKETLASLFTKLELYYDVRIVVKNQSLLSWYYSGKFRIRDGVEHVLRVLQQRHQFEYIKEEEKNIIIIK